MHGIRDDKTTCSWKKQMQIISIWMERETQTSPRRPPGNAEVKRREGQGKANSDVKEEKSLQRKHKEQPERTMLTESAFPSFVLDFAKHLSMHFSHINSFPPHKSPLREVLLFIFSPFFRGSN